MTSWRDSWHGSRNAEASTLLGVTFLQLDHTADLAFEITAPTEVELLLGAALNLVGVMTDEVKPGGDDQLEARQVAITALDGEDRLICWLNEVIYMAVVHGFLLRSAEIELFETDLRANCRGELDGFDKITSELKCATYHDLVLEKRDGGWYGRVVVDV